MFGAKGSDYYYHALKRRNFLLFGRVEYYVFVYLYTWLLSLITWRDVIAYGCAAIPRPLYDTICAHEVRYLKLYDTNSRGVRRC